MGKYVNENIAEAARQSGFFIGGTKPSRETKGSWWEVYATDSGLIGCVMVEKESASCGESFPESELHLYVDDIGAAKSTLEAAEISMLAERSNP